MKSIRKTFVLFNCAVFAFCLIGSNCKNPKSSSQGSDKEPPSHPIVVPKSMETDIIERGIDAEAGTRAIRLEWFLNPEEDLAGYEIYRTGFKKESLPPPFIGGFELWATINLDPDLIIELDTVFIDDRVELDTTYYYYLRAFDSNGNTSEPSDTVFYTLIDAPNLISPINSSSITPIFEWSYNRQDPGFYLLRVKNNITQNLIFLSKVDPDFGGNEKIQYGQGTVIWIDSTQMTLTPGREYRWRVDAIQQEGDNFWGAESNWSSFLVNASKKE